MSHILYKFWCISVAVCKLSRCNTLSATLHIYHKRLPCYTVAVVALGISIVCSYVYVAIQLVHQCMHLCREMFTCCGVCAAICHCSPAFSHIQGLPLGWTTLVSHHLVTKHYTVDICWCGSAVVVCCMHSSCPFCLICCVLVCMSSS